METKMETNVKLPPISVRRKKLLGIAIVWGGIFGFSAFFVVFSIVVYVIKFNDLNINHYSVSWRFYFHTLPYWIGILSAMIVVFFSRKISRAFNRDCDLNKTTMSIRLIYALLALVFVNFGWVIASALVGIVALSGK